MNKIAKKTVNKLKKNKIKISFAESCTGGMLSSCITSVSGSSKVFDVGLVTYSNQAKIRILNVNKKIISKYGAVSKECCENMVKNLSKISKSKLNVSVTGIAGPGGGTKKKPVGLVFIGLKNGNKIIIKENRFKPLNRYSIQKKTVKKALMMILSII